MILDESTVTKELLILAYSIDPNNEEVIKEIELKTVEYLKNRYPEFKTIFPYLSRRYVPPKEKRSPRPKPPPPPPPSPPSPVTSLNDLFEKMSNDPPIRYNWFIVLLEEMSRNMEESPRKIPFKFSITDLAVIQINFWYQEILPILRINRYDTLFSMKKSDFSVFTATISYNKFTKTTANKLKQETVNRIQTLYKKNKWFREKINEIQQQQNLHFIIPHLMHMIIIGSRFKGHFKTIVNHAKDYANSVKKVILAEKNIDKISHRLEAKGTFDFFSREKVNKKGGGVKQKFTSTVEKFTRIQIGDNLWNSEWIYILQNTKTTVDYAARRLHFNSMVNQMSEIVFRVEVNTHREKYNIKKQIFRKEEILMGTTSNGRMFSKNMDNFEALAAVLDDITPAWIITDEWNRLNSDQKSAFEKHILPILDGLGIQYSKLIPVETTINDDGKMLSNLEVDFITKNIHYIYQNQENPSQKANYKIQDTGVAWWLLYEQLPRAISLLISYLKKMKDAKEVEERFKMRKLEPLEKLAKLPDN